jgi:hypothetical protein
LIELQRGKSRKSQVAAAALSRSHGIQTN